MSKTLIFEAGRYNNWFTSIDDIHMLDYEILERNGYYHVFCFDTWLGTYYTLKDAKLKANKDYTQARIERYGE